MTPDDWAEPDITDALTVAADRIEVAMAVETPHCYNGLARFTEQRAARDGGDK